MKLAAVLETFARSVQAALARGKRSASEEVSDEPDRNLQYDLQTVEVMKKILRSDSNCIDVGCHEGSFLSEILHFAPQGTHFAFEPLPGMYQRLTERFGGSANLHLYECALSDAEGTASFQHVVTNPGYSGFRQRRYDRTDEEIQTIAVKTNRLDNLIPREIPIRFIKVDVEGAERQVFQGAIETIRRSRPVIVFEHGLGAADYYGTTPEDIYDLLVFQGGLRLFLMGAWLKSRGRASLSKAAFCEEFSTGKNFYFMAAP